jgi:hypothetical protein
VFAKIAAVIVAIGIVAGALLSLRQLRLQTVHELADVQRRVAEHDRTLWHLRVEIAARTTPERTDDLAQALGPLEPLPVPGQRIEPVHLAAVPGASPERTDPHRGGAAQ